MLARILILFCLLRVGGNMIWHPLGMKEIYFVTQAILEAGTIGYCLLKTTTKPERLILNFFFGTCVYALIKQLFFNPLKLDINEYWSFLVGVIFVIIQLYLNGRPAKGNSVNA